MIRSGQVIGKDKKGLLVCFERLAACAGCKACGREGKQTSVLVHGEAEIGDIVSVEMPDAQVLKASLLVYLLPLISFLLGLLIAGRIWPGNDLAMVVTGLTALALAALGLRAMDRRLGLKRPWQAHVITVMKQQDIEQRA